MLSTVFAKDMDVSEKSRKLNEVYNIEMDDVLMTGLKGISMTMEEEYREYLINEGRKKGFEEGKQEGNLEGRNQTLSEIIEELSIKVRLAMDHGMSVEDAMEFVPDSIYEDVRKRVEAAQ